MADGNCWMSDNLKLDLVADTAVDVAPFSGADTISWTPNSDTTSSSGNAYNVAINANYKANVNGGNWYYPWYAATAGQGTNTASPTINRSICPKGWRLPDGDTSNKSFYNLITTAYSLPSSEAGIASLKAVPLSFVAAGAYSSGVLLSSSYGYYWSATPKTSNANNAYHSYFNTSGINLEGNSSKSSGFSVRCVSI